MNNLKKLGLTALAGALAATTVNAGDVRALVDHAKVSYGSRSGSSGADCSSRKHNLVQTITQMVL